MSPEPDVPRVELRRVAAAQFQIYDHTVGAYLVTDDDAMAQWVEALCSTAPSTVAADIETRGLDVNKFSITCVTVAFHLGADTVSLLLDPLRRPQHRKLLAQVFDHAAALIFHGACFDVAPLYAHRLMTRAHIRKLGDTLVAARMVKTYDKAGRTLEDLAMAYQLMNDDRTTMSEVFAVRGLKKDEGWWATDIDTPTYAVGAMSDTVATLRLWGTPGVGGTGIMATAARYLTTPDLGMGGRGVLNADDAEQVVEDVQQVNRIVLERTARGYAVDTEFPERFREQTVEQARAAAQLLANAGIRPGNGRDLVNALDARGELPQPWPTTPTGQLKADKDALKIFTDDDAVLRSDLALAHRTVAGVEKVLGYVCKVKENAAPTGRLHPEIKILGANATGRMCLPENQRLLTRRGIVGVDDIRLGDKTLDADGNWTTVRAVHRYTDAPVSTYRLTNGMHFTCTPEHRWVTEDATAQTHLKPLDALTETDMIRLTPPPYIARQLGADAIKSVTEAWTNGAQSMAAAAAWRKELELQQCAAMAGGASVSVVRKQLLERRSADFADRLRDQGRLPNQPLLWALEAPTSDLAGWVNGAGFCHEKGAPPHSFDEQWGAAAAVALYRLGVLPRVSGGLVEVWNFTDVQVAEGPMSIPGRGRADVWCVTTDAGTFTAWGSRGPYLTGNSASKPEIQQFPKEARGIVVSDASDWVSADWKSIEPVILATASGDGQFLADMRAGKDPYEPVGQMAGIDRKLAKRKMLADMYSQGHKAAALQYGWTLDRAKEVAWAIRDSLPILYRLIDALKHESKNVGRVVTLMGRVVNQEFSFYDNGIRMNEVASRIAPNHFCQGSALDVMHYSILELDRMGLSDHVHLWMHDEIVADQEIADALTHVMATPPPFLQRAAAQRGIEAFLAVDVNGMGKRWEYV